MSGKALPALGSKRPLELADNLCAPGRRGVGDLVRPERN